MSSLNLKGIYKVYPSGNIAVTDFNLDIEDKEFIVFVGPSGCGKSTTLRMIAGLEEISAGELYIDGKLVNNVAPKDRNIAMVFQSYALYPHMTVYDNMAFGLKLRKMPKTEIDRRVKEAARILGIEIYLSRKPKALSGGQRQRVALGRAMVREPKVFLLDEPLSNLDAKLRSQMRTEITKLHNRLATTFIYVTHDQVEAMTMGTRIVVMKDGFMQQVDSPMNLYDYPANLFVAGFIGTPTMNFFDGELIGTPDKVTVKMGADEVLLSDKKAKSIENLDAYLNTGKPIVLGVRPEDMYDDESWVKNSKKPKITVSVETVEALGPETLLYCNTIDPSSAEQKTDDVTVSAKLIAKVNSRSTSKAGENVALALDIDHCHIFDKETEMTLLKKGALTSEQDAEEKPVQEEKAVVLQAAPVAATVVEPAQTAEPVKTEAASPAPVIINVTNTNPAPAEKKPVKKVVKKVVKKKPAAKPAEKKAEPAPAPVIINVTNTVPAEKKTVAKKPAEKKPVAKKPATKPAEKKPVAKKPAAKPAPKKTTAATTTENGDVKLEVKINGVDVSTITVPASEVQKAAAKSKK